MKSIYDFFPCMKLFLLLRSINDHFLQKYTTMMSCKVIEMEYENIVVTGLCVLDLVVVLENTVSVFLFWVFHGVCFHVWFCFDFLARMFKRARKNCRFFFYLIWQKKPKLYMRRMWSLQYWYCIYMYYTYNSSTSSQSVIFFAQMWSGLV